MPLAGPPNGGVTGGGVTGGGATGTTGGVGTTGWTGAAATGGAGVGASAEKLLVRTVTLLLRAFNAPVEGGVKPPAAGSISSSHAPQLLTEST